MFPVWFFFSFLRPRLAEVSVALALAGLTEGGGGVHLSGREVGSGEVSALVVVVLDVERAQLGEVDPQRAAAVVDVLTVQRLEDRK